MSLRIGVVNDPAEISYCALNPICARRGFLFDLTLLTCDALKLNCLFVEVFNEEYGDAFDNGTGTGMVGVVQRGELDTFLPVFTPTFTRAKAIAFSDLVYVSDTVLMTRAPRVTPRINWGMLWVFQWPIWIVFLLLWLISANVISWSWKTLSALSPFTGRGKSAFHVCVRLIVSNFETGLLKFQSVRATVGVWLLATLVLSSAYTGFIFTTNLSAKSRLPFTGEDSFVDCLERGECSLVVPSLSVSTLKYLIAPGTENARRIRSALKGNEIIVTPSSKIAGVIFNESSKFLVLPTTLAEFHGMTNDNEDCNFYTVPLKRISLQGAFAFPLVKNSSFLPSLNSMVANIREFGFDLHFEKKYIGPNRCQTSRRGLNLSEMRASMITTFCLLGVGMFLAMISLIMEIRFGNGVCGDLESRL